MKLHYGFHTKYFSEGLSFAKTRYKCKKKYQINRKRETFATHCSQIFTSYSIMTNLERHYSRQPKTI